MNQEYDLYQQSHQLFANRQVKAALFRLDALANLYKGQGKWLQAKQTLQEFWELYPDEVGLLTRLAVICQQLGQRNEALEKLDKLGDIHHQTGNFEGMVETIRQIMSLQPES